MMDPMDPRTYMQLPLPPLPQNQALNSTTFKVPPLDGTLNISQMWDWHYENSPNHPVFVFTDDTGSLTTLRMRDVVPAVHRAGWTVRTFFKEGVQSSSKRPLVGFLASSDTITSFTMLLAVIRAGYVCFPISVRNSANAVAHLIAKTGVDLLIVGPETSYQQLATGTMKILADTGKALPQLAMMPVYQDIYGKNMDAIHDPLPPLETEMADLALYMHSSGSTAYPKPIPYTFYHSMMMGLYPYFGERDWTGMKLAMHSVPMYHAMGAVTTFLAATSGVTLTVFKPESPAHVPTPDNLLKAAIDTGSQLLFCVPSFIETWALNPDQIRQLKQLEGLLFGGAPLQKQAGDRLYAEGIDLFTLYGSTETGAVAQMLPAQGPKDWEYFTFPKNVRAHLVPDENGNAELVVVSGLFGMVCVTNTMVDGVGAYATSDILAPHPTKPNYWKVFGRADDQIMHNTGEKTNPGPLEKIMKEDPHVQASVMFGRGRFSAGILIDPKPEYKFDPADQAKLAAFRNAIWPTVERVNEYAPQHSRIFKEMILVTSPDKPFEYTAKNDPRRHAIIANYEDEIDALYEAVNETAQADLKPPMRWSYTSAKAFVRAVVERVLDRTLLDNDDLFQNSCDSLQATWIRNSVLHAIRETTKLNTRAVPANFIYRNPTITAIASFILSLTNSEGPDESMDDEDTVGPMLQMVAKYGADFPTHVPRLGMPEKEVVLVTGTTGGLGAGLLVTLVQSAEVERVYALNRRGSQPLAERQKAVLDERGYDGEAILRSPKVILIETDMDEEFFGLSEEAYEEIAQTLTLIIHNAWPVNFNLSLSSFEPNVRTVRRFIDLALASPYVSPAKFLFISSVGVLRGTEMSGMIKEKAVDATSAVGMGYSESKWVSEKLLELASSRTPLCAVAIRVGQISGTSAGAWKSAEWFPSMVKSSVHLGCIPSANREISWIPVDVAAKAIFEMRFSDVGHLHLAHPRPVQWPAIMEPVAEHLGLSVVPYDDWVAMLARSGEGLDADSEVEAMKVNPALKIMHFFAGTGSGAGNGTNPEALDFPSLSVAEAERVAPSLSAENLPQLSREDAVQWLAYWKGIGFL